MGDDGPWIRGVWFAGDVDKGSHQWGILLNMLDERAPRNWPHELVHVLLLMVVHALIAFPLSSNDFISQTTYLVCDMIVSLYLLQIIIFVIWLYHYLICDMIVSLYGPIHLTKHATLMVLSHPSFISNQTHPKRSIWDWVVRWIQSIRIMYLS